MPWSESASKSRRWCEKAFWGTKTTQGEALKWKEVAGPVWLKGCGLVGKEWWDGKWWKKKLIR